MSIPTVTELVRNGNHVGKRVELARYRIPADERVLHGQRINGVVRVTDNPADGRGRAYLVERELERDGNGALQALVASRRASQPPQRDPHAHPARSLPCAHRGLSDERPLQPGH
jgi:hypothetical protein